MNFIVMKNITVINCDKIIAVQKTDELLSITVTVESKTALFVFSYESVEELNTEWIMIKSQLFGT